MTKTTPFNIGDEIPDADSFNTLPVGSVLTDRDGWLHTKVCDYEVGNGSRPPTCDAVDADGKSQGTFFAPWMFDATLTSLPADEAPGRPLVHFDDEKAGRDRSKARAACSEAISSCLKAEHNALLTQAAKGESVDAYALNEAITAAIRSTATRLNHSTLRREQASRFAHVAHIVQAVLENHADNLPGYEPGARSRLVDEAGTALREANGVISDLRAEVEALDVNRDAALAEGDTLRANLSQTIREANSFEAALAYAKGFLDSETRARVDGFIEGFGVGASD